MHIILFDHPEQRLSMLPFTFTRPVSGIRVGILTIKEKWPFYINNSISTLTENYLQEKFPLKLDEDNLFINGAICPDENITAALLNLSAGKGLVKGNILLGLRAGRYMAEDFCQKKDYNFQHCQEYKNDIILISEMYDIFRQNAGEIKKDFSMITRNRKSTPIEDKHTILYSQEFIFVEEGADIKAAVLNAESGPIYIGKNAVVQEGAMVRGSFALGESSCITMGCRIRGDTTIGPFCKIGGEISNSVIFGFSNKAHDGYLGNAVIGEWCNLGADTNASNLKNNYASVKLWSYKHQQSIDTGLQFCGLMMADHSKCGINTMFNTGTVVGVSSNIFGEGFPSTFIPSFAWGGASGFSTFKLEKAVEVAERVLQRRNITFEAAEIKILKTIFDITLGDRRWEK
jgi:UDP-N-acetylglucosamine diphosphorylase/glucosamine-1-phosphate N-acetyltransferase